ncbi:G-protein coupled receptor 54 [Acipenser ruthenus]|uniref:G-protein coupled receptor 54 n=1 Tax=Acipenser ruthenus TaxID=7906 RepID=A0A444TZK2_ACIRT|nr:G-protein coupled receptor 54 [Acipenser ruthenus]
MRTATNFYIANLAATDIIFLVTVQATCITLTAMSADRCYATVYPLKSLRHRTPRVAMAVSICIWIGSFILSIPIIIYQKIQEGYWYGPRSYCMEQFPSETHQRVFILYQFLVVYLLPLITISLCYSLMLKRVGQPVVEPVDNNYQLFILFQSFYPNFQANYATYKIKTWANCMSYANSSINPIVYGFMGASFRKSFKKAFPFMFRRKVRDGSVTSGAVNAEMKFIATDVT